MTACLFRTTSSINLYAFRFFYAFYLGYYLPFDVLFFWKAKEMGIFKGLLLLYPFQGVHVEPWQLYVSICILSVSLISLSVGFFPLVSGFIAWLAYVNIYWPMNYNFKPYDDNLIFFNILILAVAPLGSVLNLVNGKDSAYEKIPAWPLEFIKLNISMVYLSAFISKMVNSGLSWADGITLQHYLYERYLMTGNIVALWVADQFWICRALSIVTLIAEATFWTVLFPTPLASVAILMGLGMHFGIYVLMSINFSIFVLSYLVFIPYDRIYRLFKLPLASLTRSGPRQSSF